MDHHGRPDERAGSTEMVVGRADQAVHDPAGTGATEEVAPARGLGRLRWPVLVVVLVVMVAGALLLARPSERPDVQVRDWRADAWVATPAAPAGPIAERWSHAVPADRDLLGIAAVDGQVVVASRDRLPSPEGDRVVVESFDTRDGTRTWRREVPDRDTMVVVSDGTTTHLLSNVLPFGDPEGGRAFGGTGVATLDATTGEVRWSTGLARDGGAELLPGGDLVVEDGSGVQVVDVLSGTTRLSWPALPVPGEDESYGRRAWRDGGAWVVPTPGGWEIADRDGTVEFTVDGPETWPAVDHGVVVVGDDTRMVVRRRPGGDVAWQAELGDRVLWVDLLDRGDRGPDDPVRVVAHLGDGPPGEGQALMQERSVLVVDGRVVGPWDPRSAAAPAPWGRLRLEVDGRRLAACRLLPPEFGPTADACPADLALLDDEGAAFATAEAPAGSGVPSMVPAGWRATDAGLVLVGTEQVVLHRWDDLARDWEVDLPANDTENPATVETTARGIAIAVAGSDPARVTWYG